MFSLFMSRCACPGGMGEDCRLEERGAGIGLRLSLLPAPQVLQHPVHFLLFAQSLKDRQQVQELRVIHVIEPRLHGNLHKTHTELLSGIV